MEPDFSGYATKAGLKCSDGRTIMPDAFKHMDGTTVPLVWQHGHDKPENVLGHAVLEAREDGVYARGYFNDTSAGVNAKKLVVHEDIKHLSIYANQLVERSKQVFHGVIREVSLVLSGANPGALIDHVAVQHSDGHVEIMDDEVIIYTGLELDDHVRHMGEKPREEQKVEHADDDGPTIKDVYDTLSEEQKNVVHYMIGAALAAAKDKSAAQSATDNSEGALAHDQEGTQEMTNVFEQQNKDGDSGPALSHEDVKGIVQDAMKMGSLKEAVEAYALQHGINDIEVLFPDARVVGGTPEWESRRMEWVSGVLNGTSKSPFSRIKTRSADITVEEARALGYVKGNLKKEEFFAVKSRVTTPTTIYKKQKLDRDDIIDITDFDVVAWLKGEMRVMLDEELARAVLIGDGREVSSEDKIKDPAGAAEGAGIRSIANDHELYVTTVNVNIDDANSSWEEVIEAVMRARRFYKGSGAPSFYTTNEALVEMLLVKDQYGRRIYKSRQELEAALMVRSIVEVEVMEQEPDIIGIIVNLRDYTLGADKGGQVAMFDDFDIDYNQYKYLIETRVSGALTKIKSALLVKRVAGTDVLVEPAEPTFDGSAVTIVDTTGVVYTDSEGTTVNAAGSPYAVTSGQTMVVNAAPAAGYYFATNAEDSWSFTNNG